MKTELISLQAELEMVNAVVAQENHNLIEDLKNFIQTEIIDPTGSYLSRLSTQLGFHDNIEVTFDVGFMTPEGKEDFGSDCWFKYDDQGLQINYGTIGSWTKDNVYQISRIKMLNYICDIIPQLETRFQEILNKHKIYIEKKNEVWTINSKIKALEDEIKSAEVDSKMSSIQVGTLMCYPEKIYCCDRLFSTNTFSKKDDQWEVKKIGDKTITLMSLKSGATRRISRSDIRKHMRVTGLEIINE